MAYNIGIAVNRDKDKYSTKHSREDTNYRRLADSWNSKVSQA